MIHNASTGAMFNTCTSLHMETCPTCHIMFAIPQTLYEAAQRWPGNQADGWRLSCPLGHVWWYVGTTPAQKIKRLEKRLREANEDLSAELARHDQTKARLRGTQGAAQRARNERDRIKQRVAGGVCPCCNRTLKDLQRHMRSKHPDYVEATR